MTRRSVVARGLGGFVGLSMCVRAAEEADRILVKKARRKLLLLGKGKVFKTYKDTVPRC